jgi:hypothetical protein
VQSAEGITVSQRSNLVLERVKNFVARVRGIIRIFQVTQRMTRLHQPRRPAGSYVRWSRRATGSRRRRGAGLLGGRPVVFRSRTPRGVFRRRAPPASQSVQLVVDLLGSSCSVNQPVSLVFAEAALLFLRVLAYWLVACGCSCGLWGSTIPLLHHCVGLLR